MANGVCLFCHLQPFYCIYPSLRPSDTILARPSSWLCDQGIPLIFHDKPVGYSRVIRRLNYCMSLVCLAVFKLGGDAKLRPHHLTSKPHFTSLSTYTTDFSILGNSPSIKTCCCVHFRVFHQLKRLLYRRASFRPGATSTTRAFPIIILSHHHIINHTINHDFPGRALCRTAGQFIQDLSFY